ncbi:MAG TPA: hypothetical protein VIX19_05765 [Terriglobales bacterium]
MKKQGFMLLWHRSGLWLAAVALLASGLLPAFCPLGRLAIDASAWTAAPHSGCHDSLPATPQSPAPRQVCCATPPAAQASPSSSYATPPLLSSVLKKDDSLLVLLLPAVPESNRVSDILPPGQDVLRV